MGMSDIPALGPGRMFVARDVEPVVASAAWLRMSQGPGAREEVVFGHRGRLALRLCQCGHGQRVLLHQKNPVSTFFDWLAKHSGK